jgi:hypothetical protein
MHTDVIDRKFRSHFAGAMPADAIGDNGKDRGARIILAQLER